MSKILFPPTVTNAFLAQKAATDETACVRVLVRRVANRQPFTIRGKKRKYQATWNHEAACHVLDVPFSIWMAGVPSGIYRDNESIAHDIMGTRSGTLAPLVYLVRPWDGAAAMTAPLSGAADHQPAELLDGIAAVLTKLGAPPEAFEAVELAKTGNAAALRLFAGSITTEDPPQSDDEIHSDEGPPEEPEIPAAPDAAPPAPRRGRPRKNP